jgi:hypothetical protein
MCAHELNTKTHFAHTLLYEGLKNKIADESHAGNHEELTAGKAASKQLLGSFWAGSRQLLGSF